MRLTDARSRLHAGDRRAGGSCSGQTLELLDVPSSQLVGLAARRPIRSHGPSAAPRHRGRFTCWRGAMCAARSSWSRRRPWLACRARQPVRSAGCRHEGQRRAGAGALAQPIRATRWCGGRSSIASGTITLARGSSTRPNDFGRMGSLPTHPELLDWLAGWFLEQRPVAQGAAPADCHQRRLSASRREHDPRLHGSTRAIAISGG